MSRVRTPPETVIGGTFNLLPDTINPQFAVPEEIMDFMVGEYDLAGPDIKVIDPMAGDGNFIAKILDSEGYCDGVELDRNNYDRIVGRLPRDAGVEILHGNCMGTAPRQINKGYDAVFFSPPFVLMNELVNVDPRDFVASFHREDLAHALMCMVRDRRSNGWPGLVVIDSADEAVRDGRLLHPAADTVQYLAERYFNLCAVHRFRVSDPPEGCDKQFTELVFEKRWTYYPDALADLAMIDVESVDRRFHQEALRAL